MSKQEINPTAAELEILNILWEEQPLPVKTVHERLMRTKDVGYTTTLKIMQNMTEKGLLSRTPEGRSHLYRTVQHKEVTREKLLSRFIDNAFGGSASRLVMQLLGNSKTTEEELREIRRIIQQMDQQQQ